MSRIKRVTMNFTCARGDTHYCELSATSTPQQHNIEGYVLDVSKPDNKPVNLQLRIRRSKHDKYKSKILWGEILAAVWKTIEQPAPPLEVPQ